MPSTCEILAPKHLIDMPRPLRIYYPGFISLFALTFLIWTYCKDSYDFVHQQRPRAIWMLVPSEDAKLYKTRGWPTLQEQLKGKHIVEIELDEPYIWGTKPAKINFIKREIERITFTCQSNTVVKVVMGEGATFSDIVGLTKLMQFYGVRQYTLRDACFYIFGNEPQYSKE